MLLSLRNSLFIKQTLIIFSPHTTFTPFANTRRKTTTCSSSLPSFSTTPLEKNHQEKTSVPPISSKLKEDALLLGYIYGEKKATEVAHSIWKSIVRKGDIVVDATCGNGNDTLALVKMVSDDESRNEGRVYGMDIQKCAIENTTSLLNSNEKENKEIVKLFLLCHSRMEEIVPKGDSVRLVAFNLGYLPGGDKAIITKAERTLEALQAASRLLGSGGLISILVYVGHSGGREEYEMVQAFASGLSVENWVCSKFEMLNRPLAPILVFLFKK